MIKPLRRRHRWLVTAVAVLVVPLFFAALAVRPERPLEERLEGRFERGAAAVVDGTKLEFSTQPPMSLAIDATRGVLTLDAPEAVEAPGLLLYWQPAATEFPEGAILIGAVHGHGSVSLAFEEAAGPFGAQTGSSTRPFGSFLLYSLGHGEEVARVDWPGDSG